MENFISVYITAPSAEKAERIAKTLIEERLVACVNLFPQVKSIYWWQDKIQTAEEIVLIAKTRAEAFPHIERAVMLLSEEECPCVLAMPISEGNDAYLQWLSKNVDVGMP